MKKRLLAVLLALCMALALLPAAALAADDGTGTYQLKLDGAYDYSGAYAVLDSLNSYRRENDLPELVMDSELLAAAMQRAAETAIYFDHTRPDGSSCFTAFPSKFTSGRKENIAVGFASADAVMNGWKNSSGHNANMLADTNRSVGVGVFVDSNGNRYWVQAFASGEGSPESSRTSGIRSVTANVTATADKLSLSASHDAASLRVGDSVTLTLSNFNKESGSSRPRIYLTYAETQAANIAAVSINSDGEAVVTGVGTGTTTLKLGVDGSSGPVTVSVPITVGAASASLTEAMFTVDTANEIYDGRAKTKTIVGTDGDTSLTEGTDYTVAYANNINVGTAVITITGEGFYTGTLTYRFTIDKAERILTAALNSDQLRTGGFAGVITMTDNAAGDRPSYSYSSSDTSVATVIGGTVTPVGVGTAAITIYAPATANYQSGFAAIDVTVTDLPAQDLRFTVDKVEKSAGDPAFTYTAANSSEGGGAVTYSSSNSGVATVDAASGRVTVLGVGTTVITATAAKVDGVWAETKASYTLFVSTESWTNPFSDVTTRDWFYNEVSYAVRNGLMNGVGGGKFNPLGKTTRGMVVTILARMAGVNTNGGSTWYEKGMAWAVENDVSSGAGPEASITREQMAVMLYRYVGKPSVNTSVLNSYPDRSSIHDWTDFPEAMAWAVENGIINGISGKLEPARGATRAETATILMRFRENILK